MGAEFPSRENLAGTRGTPKRYFSAKKKEPKKYFPVGTTPRGGVTGLEKKPGVERYGHKNYTIK